MKTRQLVKVAGQSIVKNKMRTLLTMLGIVIGVGAVIIMVAVGNGAQEQIKNSIGSLGTNLLIVMPGSATAGGASQGAGTFSRLTVEDAEALKRDATLLAGVSPVVSTRTQVIGGEGNWRTMINGVSTDFAEIRDWTVSSGELFSESDVRGSRKVAVLGKTVADNLFPGTDPVGEQVQIGRVPFSVVGVLAGKGQNAGGQDQDDVILMPYTTARTRLSGNVRIGQIVASAATADDMAAAQEELSTLMREAHRLGDNPDDFTVRNQTEIAEAASSTTKVMSSLLAAIASISLLVGGIGIMNIMLVSVTERTREIGIRMAIGARGRDVLTQFLVESVAMSVAGGLMGLAVGFGGAALLARLTGWTTSTPLSAVLLAVGFSAAVGVFFGYYPARKAAALNPIQALRYE
ncbi:ABC transporter permease [Longimicrobium terrae]|uniref:Putative ABC transport system permease protein n=1 Tax=Longimicrobium terrae TaxID=1639882 RepID=A0A841H1E2_9BACT|nr:ABC transporter permease [Longimicrobium terrae]MBB4637368.1 putative ABC transport system permease protein [Longimicrobium terrae]MBB6071766.1 putative ABC transport system permease protein [Longimicrobium terrae]NNC28526.1 FtsX-like permease family protein [Longimicrobium terrae]